MTTKEILIAAIEAYEKSLKVCNSKKSIVNIKLKLQDLNTNWGICGFLFLQDYIKSLPIKDAVNELPRYNMTSYRLYKPAAQCTKLSEVKLALNLRLQWLKDFQTKLKTEK